MKNEPVDIDASYNEEDEAALRSSNLISSFFKKRNEELKRIEKNSIEELLQPFEEGFEQRIVSPFVAITNSIALPCFSYL